VTVTGVADMHQDGLLTLREAIAQANTDAAGGQSDMVTFADSLGNAIITLAAGELELSGASTTATETIDGAGRITVSGDDVSRVFQIDAGVRAALDGLTITRGNTNNGDGGGLYNEHGTLTVSNCTFDHNTADSPNGDAVGGGIYNGDASTLTVDNCTFAGNTAIGGGAIGGGGTLTVSNSTFAGNAAALGGGIATEGGTLTVSNCTFADNAASYVGGGILNFGALMVSNSTFAGNSADGDVAVAGGGGIYNAGTLTVSNSTFDHNTVFIVGGGIYNHDASTLTVSNSTFAGNSAGLGGGIGGGGTLTVSNSAFAGNSAEFGGGVANIANTGTLTVSNCTFDHNTAVGPDGDGIGGGIGNDGTLTVSNSTFTGNVGFGGGICSFNRSFPELLLNTIVAGNSLSDGSPSDIYDEGFLDDASSYNLIGVGGSGGLEDGVNGNIVGVSDPRLGALGDHGGPTQTIPLLPGSPAINAGTAAGAPGTDQRGVPRGSVVSIGAFQATASAFVLTPPDTVTAGVPFDLVVKAVDVFGQVAVGYTGTVTFATDDPEGTLPDDYTFTAEDAGSHTFSSGVTLYADGSRITVTDTVTDKLTGSVVIRLG
jgi:hypothetical protein